MSNAPADLLLPPHPELVDYYSNTRGKGAFLRQIFDDTAQDYDRVERLLALGSGRWYRRKALLRAGLTTNMRVLDVATGTGLVAREALQIVGSRGSVVGVDPSAGMLHHAKSLPGLSAVLGRGEKLPMADTAFDLVSMGYALRHLPDLHAAFTEFFRVLRPGGQLCVLEITRPPGAIRRQFLRAYFKLILPIASRVIITSRETRRLWQYYWETIDQCVEPDIVLRALHDAGFRDISRNISLGLFSEYSAKRPQN